MVDAGPVGKGPQAQANIIEMQTPMVPDANECFAEVDLPALYRNPDRDFPSLWFEGSFDSPGHIRCRAKRLPTHFSHPLALGAPNAAAATWRVFLHFRRN